MSIEIQSTSVHEGSLIVSVEVEDRRAFIRITNTNDDSYVNISPHTDIDSLFDAVFEEIKQLSYY